MNAAAHLWFGNVEFVVAKEVGQEPVHYVGNIYKYYVAYKLTQEQSRLQTQARQAPAQCHPAQRSLMLFR